MTIESCKQNFLLTLNSHENRVIALSGKWGTGKTHLWRQVQKESNDEAIQNAAVVSLFGVSSLNELKTKVAQALLPRLQDDKVAAQVSAALSGLTKLAKAVHRGFGALDDLPILALPTLLGSKFLVIDDIERKHQKLNIDEILGFIDECVQTYKCRVLLILNDDKLKDKEIWEQFREKVIDHELRLETTAAEAFQIAKAITSTDWAEDIEAASVACGITNIRILGKIIRAANRLLAHNGELSPEVVSRVVPPIVLLSAIHYKSLPEGPTFEYVMSHNAALSATARALRQQRPDHEQSKEDALHEQWDSLLRKLKIHSGSEFEKLVMEFLRTGLMEPQAIRKLIQRYQEDGRILNTRNRVSSFFQHYNWHPEIAESDLIDELRALLPGVEYIEAPTLSYLIDLADELTSDPSLGQEFLITWSVALEETYPDGMDPSPWGTIRPIRSDLTKVLEAAYARRSNSTTLVETCNHIRATKGWGSAEENLLKSITAAEYETEIRNATGFDLETIILQSMQFAIHKDAYQSFGGVGDRFVQACQAIVTSNPDSRLTSLIRRFFTSRDQQGLL
ncbi:P-loop NTPase fold protein [Pseudomonas lactis]|uniref:P-loop NTPase fold protein n=1 Tax=Pseudomonas lactis TaxID=1615674 RepID=UPI0022C2A1E4|nr:P-loop NTPase fold protein [Pseudomonas lactis]GLH50590.1 hypothetical protein RS3R2_42780 [Pseudomonas lactis]